MLESTNLSLARKQSTNEDVIEMNGCVCHTVRGDLVQALYRLHKQVRSLDAVLIETTGMADPAPVAQTSFVDNDGMTAVVDAAHVLSHFDEQKLEGVESESVEQLASADRINLNKRDLLLTPQTGVVWNQIFCSPTGLITCTMKASLLSRGILLVRS